MMVPRALLAVSALLPSVSMAKEMAVDMELKAELFDSGVRHEQIMAMKNVSVFHW